MTDDGKVGPKQSQEPTVKLSKTTTEAVRRLKLIHAEIKELDPALRAHAVTLLLDREFGTEDLPAGPARPIPSLRGDGGREAQSQMQFSDLVERWTPNTQAEWALLGAYFLSHLGNQETFTSQSVNTVLKQHGNGVSNITRAFAELAEIKPALVLQVKKGGTTKQARKLYRLTTQGAQLVEEKLVGKSS